MSSAGGVELCRPHRPELGWGQTASGTGVPKPIDAQLIEARMRDLAQNAVMQTVSLFKGAIFALAAVLLLEIVTQQDGRILRLVLWTASFGLALTSYNAWLNASVIDFRESVADVVLIVVQMMSELMLFVTLTPRFSDQAWRGWVLLYGIFTATTAARMLFFRSNLAVAVNPSLQPMLERLGAGHRRAARRLLAVSILALVLAAPIILLSKASPWPAWVSMGFAPFAAVISLLDLIGIHRQRLMMERMLEDALIAEKAAGSA